MIPRLVNTYPFTGTGITLTDTISCKVTEERNGAFELEMVVATTTPYFEEIKEGRYILAKPNHTQWAQAFEIYEISRPINQRVTIRAHHISYRLSFIPAEPFSCTGITDTLNGLISHSMETNPFTFTTTITNEQSTYNQIAPASIRSRLGGTEGSVLDVFGGEYLWDNLTVNLLLHRGQDNGVQLRVAKNISALEQNTNLENVVTGALPYWSNEDGTVNLYGDIQYNSHVNDYDYKRTVLLDLSEQFETAPSSAQLNTAAQQYVNQANLGIVNTNIKLSFVDLADTNEYEGSPLERVNLCDTVTVIYNPLSITYQAKAIRLTYDVLAERTLEVEVGDAKSTIAKTISDLVGDISSVVTVGKKLVSVTQKIDREVGEISSTVASVQQTVDGSLNHITYLYAYGDSATSKPSDSAFTYSTMPPLVSGKYIWRMSMAYTNENPTSNPTKTYEMIQGATGSQGERGEKGDTGSAGNGIESISYYYATSTTQTQPSASSITSTTIPTLSDTNKYLWQKEVIEYTELADKVTVSLIAVYGDRGSQGEQGQQGATGNGISSITYYYKATTNQTAPSASSVTSTSIPTLSATNKYLWQKQHIVYTDGNTKDTVALIGVYGDKGDKGDTGNGISSITNYYKATTTQTAPSASSITSTSIPTLSETNKYLWVKQHIAYTDGTSKDNVALIAVYGDKGEQGATGNGISAITYYYKATTNQTQPSASEVTSTSIPTLSATNKYLWQKQHIAYTDGTSKDTVALIAVYGDKGDTGATGEDGVSVTGIDNLYYLKNARLDIVPNGNTTQGANPSPSSPQAIHSVSGDNEIRVVGFNIWDEVTANGYYGTNGAFTPNASYIAGKNKIPLLPSTQYCITSLSGNLGRICFYNADGSFNSTIVNYVGATATKYTFTTNANVYYMAFDMRSGYGTTYKNDICVNVSDTEKNGTYEPYKAQVYPINLPVENLLDFNQWANDIGVLRGEKTVEGNSITLTATGNDCYTRYTTSDPIVPIAVLPNTTYTLSWKANNNNDGMIYLFDGENRNQTISTAVNNKNAKSFTFNTGSHTSIAYRFGVQYSGQSITYYDIQLERGSKASTYNPYGSPSIELNGLSTYKDYFHKSDGKWYLHKEFNRVDLGALPWVKTTSSTISVGYYFAATITDFATSSTRWLCENYPNPQTVGLSNVVAQYGAGVDKMGFTSSVARFYVIDSTYTDVLAFKEAVNGVELVYRKETATETEITDTVLVAQLDNLALAISYDGGTNLLQTNSDNPFILTYNTNALTRPSKPVAEVTASSNLPEVWSLQPATFINGYRYYNSLQVHYDNNTLTWTDVVEDSSMTYVSQQVSTMNTDIVQNAEAIALKADRSTVDTSISSLNNRVGKVESDSAELQVTASGISETVSSIQSNLNDNYLTTEETKAEIKKSADSISETFTQTVTDEINGVTNTVSTMIRRSGTGIDIGIEGTDNSFVSHFDNDSLDFNNTSTDTTVAWVDASDGLGGKELSVGDYKQQSNRWRIFTRQNGSHLTFTRHS